MNVSLPDPLGHRQNSWENRMPGSPASSPVTEKPFHYSYLKEFRVEQCKAFLQHKCSQHRPYTCFHWHFMNQRRRRPTKKRDGTFSYSPDVYCSTYDETTGMCPNGEECPYLHRTAGDTERRYHLRYYKTSTCVYETDSRGFCIKNGPHCAFAHGPHDIRPPVYDVRELQGGGLEDEERLISPLVGSLEKERGVLVDDPRWQECSFVLTYYKTGPCKRPPRLCRQGYACPFYHNNKDRRRTPKTHKYRSTPCPNVKLNDEWSDSVHCDQGDACQYCHTRTEQQFHPEIYKSTKCNDVQQTGYCPRGPFCAFAHGEKELTAPRDLTDEPMITTPSPVMAGSSVPAPSLSGHTGILSTSPHSTSLPRPIGRPASRGGGVALGTGEGFQKAPGAEVKSKSFEEDQIALYLRKQVQAIDSDYTIDDGEKSRRKNLLRLSLSSSAGMSPDTNFPQAHSLPSSVSDTLEAMVGGGLDDLTLEDIDSAGLTDDPSDMYNPRRMVDRSPMAQGFLQTLHQPSRNSSSSSYPYSTPLGPLSPYGPSSGLPQSHPGPFHHIQTFGSGGGFSGPSPHHPPSSPGPLHSPYHPQQQQQQQQQQQRYGQHSLRAPPASPSKQSPMFHAAMGSPIEKSELASLRDELRQTKHQLALFHDSWKQAKLACEAWKKEAEGAAGLESKLREMEGKVRGLQSAAPLRGLENTDVTRLPLSKLEQVQQQLRGDLERVETSIRQRVPILCTQCKEYPRVILMQPCNHCVLCETCAERMGSDSTCPYCNERITGCTKVILP